MDDEGFIKALIEAISTEYPVDLKRIYVACISNGALFAHYFAGRNADLVTAIGCVGGSIPLPYDQSFDPVFSVSTLIINGTKDPIVPFNGGPISPGERGKVLSALEALGLWTEKNKCQSQPKEFSIPNRNPRDGCVPYGYRWANGEFGSEVVFVKIEGGGHTWPGSLQYLPKIFIGNVCRDFSATRMIWDFFKRHAKPD